MLGTRGHVESAIREGRLGGGVERRRLDVGGARSALRSFPTHSSIGETLGHDLAMIAQLYKETDPPVFIHR